MTTTRPVQKPITGKEDLGDLTRPEVALAQFYRAFNGRDMALMQQNWDTSEKAAMDNPLGGIKRGWPEIRSVYERLFSPAPRACAWSSSTTPSTSSTRCSSPSGASVGSLKRATTSSSLRYAQHVFSALPAGDGAKCTTTVRSSSLTYSRLIRQR